MGQSNENIMDTYEDEIGLPAVSNNTSPINRVYVTQQRVFGDENIASGYVYQRIQSQFLNKIQ